VIGLIRAPITYAFFVIVGLLLAPTLWLLARSPRPIPGYPDDTHLPSPALTRWLDVVALISGLWGLALFVTDRGPSALIWAWPGDLLTSRLIAVMLLTIAAGALVSRRRADLARVILVTTIVYSFGLSAASLWGLMTGQPLRPAYALVFASIAVISWRMLVTAPVALKTLQSATPEPLESTRYNPPPG
jgi:hypothetical protein